MADYKYSFSATDAQKEKIAYAVGRDLGISLKSSIEICNAIRYKTTEDAERILNEAMTMKKAIPFKRFMDGVGHKPGKGMASGRYPLKACTGILTVLKSAEKNAEAKGLGQLKIQHIRASKGSDQWHMGRQRRRKMKRTHIEIMLEEIKTKSKPKTQKPAPKAALKPAAKPVPAPVKSESQVKSQPKQPATKPATTKKPTVDKK